MAFAELTRGAQLLCTRTVLKPPIDLGAVKTTLRLVVALRVPCINLLEHHLPKFYLGHQEFKFRVFHADLFDPFGATNIPPLR